jgi:hypothetical protein
MDWTPIIVAGVTAVSSVIGSAGFLARAQRKDTTRAATTRVIMGLAYDKIMTLGVGYIDRGWITKDEFEELSNYLYDPYKLLGGNGVAERVMNEVSSLPIRSHNKYSEIFQNRREDRDFRNDKRSDYKPTHARTS